VFAEVSISPVEVSLAPVIVGVAPVVVRMATRSDLPKAGDSGTTVYCGMIGSTSPPRGPPNLGSWSAMMGFL
jgi:hypothetical protein